MKKKWFERKQQNLIPVLPLRDIVVYPNVIIPLFVGRPKSIRVLTIAMDAGKQIFLVAQRKSNQDNPGAEDLYRSGTLANILQLMKLPDGTVKVLVEGLQRARIKEFIDTEDVLLTMVEPFKDVWRQTSELESLIRAVLRNFEEYIKRTARIPGEILPTLKDMREPGRLADTIVMHMQLKVEDRQKILETQNARDRLRMVLVLLESELDILQIDEKIRDQIKSQVEKSQREYYLTEKMKAIKKELGQEGEKDFGDELSELEKNIEAAGMNKEANEKASSELRKLKMMPPMSPEFTVSRNYLDWLLALPWKKKSKINKNLSKAEFILEEDHYGLEKIKERIIEYLAVQQRTGKAKGPILCLVGPPGVGKTSLGKSLARATGREFIRVALGGVRDEAEIRGHRRTYIGSLPGKILQKMAKAKVRNPLFMLDEVDKMSMDFRGDPSSALLEVLDPEQNHTFNDHYLEVDYDLSNVLFVCTANSLDIPDPLLDRMEVLRLEGYTEDEKLNIAMKYLVPKQIKENGLKNEEILITKAAILDIIRYYTREAGVRSLERAISKICRKVVKAILLKPTKKKIIITPRSLEKYLGVKHYRFGLAESRDQIGQVTGLAWTEIGGDLLTIETVIVPGKGNPIYTGSLGDVMQESIQAAITVVRSRAEKFGIAKDFYIKNDIHVHVPEGATPKDGPSAGISMCTALVSTLTKIPVRADVAMTGEITLRGEVLPIGGLKEKLLAALRGGIKTVIIPSENKKDLKELPKNITQNLIIKPVRWIDEVLEIALQHMPEPKINKNKSKI